MPIEMKATLDAVTTAADIIGHIVSLKSKLTAQPQPAVRDLAAALEQIGATFHAVTTEIARYKALGVTDDALRQQAPALAALEGSALRQRVAAARGHCTVIDNIYRQHLDHWFRGALSEMEYIHVKADFQLLGEADVGLFERMTSICNGIASEATAVHDLVLDEKWGDARQRILDSRQGLRRVEEALASAMEALSKLKDELIGLSGVTQVSGAGF